MALFRVVEGGDPITATMLLRSLSGEVMAVDLHAARRGDQVVGVFRLASDVEVPDTAPVVREFTAVTEPASDVAFRLYVLRALRRMPEPTLDGLALRVRRLYPHAVVDQRDDVWVAQREPDLVRQLTMTLLCLMGSDLQSDCDKPLRVITKMRLDQSFDLLSRSHGTYLLDFRYTSCVSAFHRPK